MTGGVAGVVGAQNVSIGSLNVGAPKPEAASRRSDRRRTKGRMDEAGPRASGTFISPRCPPRAFIDEVCQHRLPGLSTMTRDEMPSPSYPDSTPPIDVCAPDQ